jgi:3-hydroxyisobutyrate dehydrogenase-like beta-hydroxyacid dehydrogenase
MKKIKVGFIGLGLMGLPMVKNILKKKYPLIAWSRSKKNYKKIQKLGAKTCQNLIDLPAKCQVIIMMLVDDKVCMQISNKLKNKLKKDKY